MKKIYTKAIAFSCCLLIVLDVYNIVSYNEIRRREQYRMGIPEVAKGAEIEREVTEYDKEAWRYHIGYESGPDKIFTLTKNSDADRMGAKRKYEIIDFEREKDNILFFNNFILNAIVELEDIPEAENLYDVCEYITTNINALSNISNPEGGPVLATLWTIAVLTKLTYAPQPWFWLAIPSIQKVISAAENASNAAGIFSFDTDYINSVYNKKIDGYILERDFWDWTKEPFKKNPDIKRQKVPFIKDPDDWYETWELLTAFKVDLLNQVQEIIDLILILNDTLTEFKENYPVAYGEYMLLLKTALLAVGRIESGETPEYGDWGHTLIDACLNPTGENQVQDGQKGLYAITTQLADTIPGKFGFLWQLFTSNLPVLSPVDKYLSNIVKAFDIDGRTVETGIKGLDPTTEIIGDAWVDGNTIIIEFKYADPYEERDGWRVEFTYNNYGDQQSVVFKGSEVFYEFITHPSSVEQRIIPVILGIIIVVTLSALTLISFYIRHKLKKIKINKIRTKYGRTIKKMEK